MVNLHDCIMYRILETKIKALYLAKAFLLFWGQTFLSRKCRNVRGFSLVSICSMFIGHGQWIRFLPCKLAVGNGFQAQIEDGVDQQFHYSPTSVGSLSFCCLLWPWSSSWEVEEGQTKNPWTHAQIPWTQMIETTFLWA